MLWAGESLSCMFKACLVLRNFVGSDFVAIVNRVSKRHRLVVRVCRTKNGKRPRPLQCAASEWGDLDGQIRIKRCIFVRYGKLGKVTNTIVKRVSIVYPVDCSLVDNESYGCCCMFTKQISC